VYDTFIGNHYHLSLPHSTRSCLTHATDLLISTHHKFVSIFSMTAINGAIEISNPP
jgi:hypothetical protein